MYENIRVGLMFLWKRTNSHFKLIIKVSGINGIILVKDFNKDCRTMSYFIIETKEFLYFRLILERRIYEDYYYYRN